MWLGSLRESQFRYRRNEGMQLQLAQMTKSNAESSASVQVRLPGTRTDRCNRRDLETCEPAIVAVFRRDFWITVVAKANFGPSYCSEGKTQGRGVLDLTCGPCFRTNELGVFRMITVSADKRTHSTPAFPSSEAGKPHAFGLFDMHGNVFEWCLDWYEDGYKPPLVIDPQGPSSGISRVDRGGSWDLSSDDQGSANRIGHGSDGRSHRVGFRVVRETED